VSVISRAWAWVKERAVYFKTFNPAQLRGVWVAILALAGTLGIAVSDKLDARVNAVIGFLVVAVPILQGWWTSHSVVPNAVHAQAVEAATYADPPNPTPDVLVGAVAPTTDTTAPNEPVQDSMKPPGPDVGADPAAPTDPPAVTS